MIQLAIPMATPTDMLVPGSSPDSGDGLERAALVVMSEVPEASVDPGEGLGLGAAVVAMSESPEASVDPGEGLDPDAPSRPATVARWILEIEFMSESVYIVQ
jgi:hypothetical protein